ncbi:MAG: hypothetical protein FJX71_03750 [Alphaproteobacteria bacterium]|nr:hypothetical protein [Alphaproteobacteria bacterium]
MVGKYIENKTFDEIKVGDSASLQRKLTFKDLQLFAIVSGDMNPAHLDEEYAKSSHFHTIIAHGMWGGSLISAVLGMLLPGPGTIYLSQTLKFLRPVIVGDVITAKVTVRRKHSTKSLVVLECICQNQNGKKVITGIAKVFAPTEKVSRPKIRMPKIVLKDNKTNP